MQWLRRTAQIRLPLRTARSDGLNEMIGTIFSRLTVLAEESRDKWRHRRYRCVCVCGTEVVVVANKLKAGTTKSCGCLHVEMASTLNLIHGAAKHGKRTGAYRSWRAMHQRCVSHPHYISHGISICERWFSFENFLADMGERPEGLTLDRYPKRDGNYLPGNCRWATWREQRINQPEGNRRLGRISCWR